MLSAVVLSSILASAAEQDGLVQHDSAADVDRGRLIFNNLCRTCHTLKRGDHRLGPSLAGLIGRPVGSEPGYAFSASLIQSGLLWSPELLDNFVEDPDRVFPGNAMRPYSGLASERDRTDLIGFIRMQAAIE